MSDLTHFDLQPLSIDPATKAVSVAPTSRKAPRTLVAELEKLNQMHHALLNTEGAVSPAGVPLPPVPVNPKRSAQITKIRDNANAEFKKSHYAEAIKLYTLGIDMAAQRPLWEPSQLAREELSALYANRAQAHMSLQQWPEGAVDAETSVEVKRVGNAKAWWRRGRCLMEMGRIEEGREWVRRGIETEGGDKDLTELLVEIESRGKKRGA